MPPVVFIYIFMGSNQVLFDFFGICRYKHIILLSSSQLVTNVFFKNWSKNSRAFVCNLAIIGPRPVNLVQIFSSIIDPKIPRRSRVACNLAIIGHRPVEVPIYIPVTYVTQPFLLLRYLSILMIIAWRTYLAIPSDCFHISWTLCFIPFGSRSTFMWRIYNAIWRHLKFRFRQERNAFICPFDKEIRVK